LPEPPRFLLVVCKAPARIRWQKGFLNPKRLSGEPKPARSAIMGGCFWKQRCQVWLMLPRNAVVSAGGEDRGKKAEKTGYVKVSKGVKVAWKFISLWGGKQTGAS